MINYTAYTDILTLEIYTNTGVKKKYIYTHIYLNQLPIYSLVLTEGVVVQLKTCHSNHLC